MKYYLIAGEASGDLHGANLVRALKSLDSDASFRGVGGQAMQSAGVALNVHYRELSFMGFIEVLQNLSTVSRIMKSCKADIKSYVPTALILIDFSGFNLRMAKWARQNGIIVHYYIAPQVWASLASRVEKIRTYVDHLYVTLPFEPEFYAKHNYEVTFVGHPLIDAIAQTSLEEIQQFKNDYNLNEKPLLAILPGSRKQEVSRVLPTLLKAIANQDEFKVVIAGAPSLPLSFYEEYLEGTQIIFGHTQKLLQAASLAVVTSGTATLEAALMGTPQIVVYRTSSISYAIARKIITLKHISLVNLILNREAVKELIQNELTPENVTREIERLKSPQQRLKLGEDYQELRTLLGSAGASSRAAKAIYENTCTHIGQAASLLD